MKALLQYLLVGSRGGMTRIKIVHAVSESPKNMNQLKEELKLDYKTVQHHIRLLVKNRVLEEVTKGYGAAFVLSDLMKEDFEEIWNQFGKK